MTMLQAASVCFSYTSARWTTDTYNTCMYNGRGLSVYVLILTLFSVHVSGVNGYGDTCALPFRYQGKYYNDCITSGNDETPWCGTTHDFDSDYAWGICASHTSNGRHCSFPFKYQGVEYNTCITKDHPTPWCATTHDYDLHHEWGVCLVFTQRGETCQFPFVYQGVQYNWCTLADHSLPWCATSSNYDEDKKWDLCVYYIT